MLNIRLLFLAVIIIYKIIIPGAQRMTERDLNRLPLLMQINKITTVLKSNPIFHLFEIQEIPRVKYLN
jgi:hypothetical protein